MRTWRSTDPIRDFERWDSDLEDELERLPKCKYCEEPIQQDTAVYIDGFICDECLEGMRQAVVDW